MTIVRGNKYAIGYRQFGWIGTIFLLLTRRRNVAFALLLDTQRSRVLASSYQHIRLMRRRVPRKLFTSQFNLPFQPAILRSTPTEYDDDFDEPTGLKSRRNGGHSSSPICENGKSSDLLESGDSLETLCQLLGSEPQNSVRLDTKEDGVRGVFSNRAISKGNVILSIPLSSCLCDNDPPAWFPSSSHDEKTADDDSDLDITDLTMTNCYNNPSAWATNLAASLIDLQIQNRNGKIGEGHALWLSMLPNREYLHASLPVHWTEETVQSACCTPLELAVDSAYFARYQANEDLIEALTAQGIGSNDILGVDTAGIDLLQVGSDALDIVQTRSCRLERISNGRMYGPPIRVLAPIFDFINHGSSRFQSSRANACFALEECHKSQASDFVEGEVDWKERFHLVVRTTMDIHTGDEVLIDYGESTRPAWKCLLSYGFIPEIKRRPDGASNHDEADPDEANADDDEDEVAEVYMAGIRYEVGRNSIPEEMVTAAAQAIDASQDGVIKSQMERDEKGEDKAILTPEIALYLAQRISDVAYLLLLEPELEIDDSIFQVVSNRLAASLRWSQHRVLLDCASNLRDCARDNSIN